MTESISKTLRLPLTDWATERGSDRPLPTPDPLPVELAVDEGREEAVPGREKTVGGGGGGGVVDDEEDGGRDEEAVAGREPGAMGGLGSSDARC